MLDEKSSIDIKAQKGEVLAKILKKNKVPLAFDCGFNMECATCAVLF
jgi:ferredoxin